MSPRLKADDFTGGVTDFCFGRYDETRKEMFICAEQRLWRLQFGGDGEEFLPAEQLR